MAAFKPIRELADLPSVATMTPRTRATRVLMADPEYFDVEYVINVHMQGQVGKVDKNRARAQWQALKTTYELLKYPVSVVTPVPALPDLVFTANQCFPFTDPSGKKVVVPSIMHAPERRAEVEHVRTFFEQQGYQTSPLDPTQVPDFESMGDALWHPTRRLIFGGWGQRSHPAAYAHIAAKARAQVIELQLTDPRFYHLDTCLGIVDEHCAVIAPMAFQPQGLEILKEVFPELIEATEHEAANLFVCNGHSPDGKHYIVQKGSVQVNRQLTERGYQVIEVDTSEYMKSGGSVFCMKMMWAWA